MFTEQEQTPPVLGTLVSLCLPVGISAEAIHHRVIPWGNTDIPP